jgi:hypothetical protein
MPRFLTDKDIHLLLQMCIDAEQACTRFIEESREKGDSSAATAAIQRKEQYEILKRKIVAEIQGDQSSLMEDSMVFSERVRNMRGKQ